MQMQHDVLNDPARAKIEGRGAMMEASVGCQENTKWEWNQPENQESTRTDPGKEGKGNLSWTQQDALKTMLGHLQVQR